MWEDLHPKTVSMKCLTCYAKLDYLCLHMAWRMHSTMYGPYISSDAVVSSTDEHNRAANQRRAHVATATYSKRIDGYSITARLY